MNGDMFQIVSDLRGRIAQLEGELLAHQDMMPLRTARIAAQAATIERLTAEIVGLKQSLALDEISMRANGVGQWSPVACDSSIACDCECGGELFAWCNPDSIEAVDGDTSISIHFPDGYALCKRNQGDYVTVSRGYIEALEAKANALK